MFTVFQFKPGIAAFKNQYLRDRLRSGGFHSAEFHEDLELTDRILAQQMQYKNKLSYIQSPFAEVECIAKGKVDKKFRTPDLDNSIFSRH